MNERIKQLRKALNLTQTEFAGRLGSAQNTITGYESGRRVPSSQMISLICKEFSVNEDWLRTGEGTMFTETTTSELNALAAKYSLSDAERILIDKFVKLRPEIRGAFTDFIQEAAAAIGGGAEQESELDIDAEVEDYRRQLIEQKKVREKSPASAGGETATEKEA